MSPPPPQYSDKGESYEYNASALERHMNTLASGNQRPARAAADGSAADLADMRTRVFGADASAALKSAYAPAASTAGFTTRLGSDASGGADAPLSQ